MTNIPPYEIAHVIISVIDGVLRKIGIPTNNTLEEIIYMVIVIGIASGIGWLIGRVAVFITNKTRWFKKVFHSGVSQPEKTLLKVSRVIPPIVFLSLIGFAFSAESRVLFFIVRIAEIYLILTVVVAICGILDFLWKRYDEIGNTRNHPLKGLPQITKGIVWLCGVIVVVSVLVGKSPLALFTGLGAFAAVVMLVFKDSILGLVAGVQLSQNDMLRVGDWIVVPGTPANGIVTDVSLTVVKVQNWDNTMAMLPPYTLVSTSFQNWRAMFESGRRQINRTCNISASSVHVPSIELLEKLKELPFLAEYIELKQKQADEGEVENTRNRAGLANGTIGTNLGLFRAYLIMYLRHHPLIAQDAFMLVNEQEPTPQGIPIRLYCYTSITDWVSYESVQSEIFEHVVVMAPVFELEVFQLPTEKSINKFTVKV